MILPAAISYLGRLNAAGSFKAAIHLSETLAGYTDELVERIHALERAQHEAHGAGDVIAEAKVFVNDVIPAQNALREIADTLETVVADDLWPLPKYREILFQY